MADKKTKSPVDRFKELYDVAEQIGDTAELAHSEAYIKAANAVLKGKNGRINLKLLNQAKNQKAFADEMAKHYLAKANEHFKSKIGQGDQIEADQLMNAYAKTTYKQLHDAVRGFKGEYNVKVHEDRRNDLIAELRRDLNRSASGHLTDDDKGALVKSMGADSFIDANKAGIDDLIGAYNVYRNNDGSLSKESLAKAYQRSGREITYFKSAKKK